MGSIAYPLITWQEYAEKVVLLNRALGLLMVANQAAQASNDLFVAQPKWWHHLICLLRGERHLETNSIAARRIAS
jgi:hypothetical protein